MFVNRNGDIEDFKFSLAGGYKSYIKYNSINCQMEKQIKNQELNSTKSGPSSKNQGIIKEKNIRDFIEHHLPLQPHSSTEIDENRQMTVCKLTATIDYGHNSYVNFRQPDFIKVYKIDDIVEKLTKSQYFHTLNYKYFYSVTKNSNNQSEEYMLKITEVLKNGNKNNNEKSIKCGDSFLFREATFKFFIDENEFKINIYIYFGKINY
jgi:hypothetical protein